MDIWSILIIILIAQGLFNFSLLIRSTFNKLQKRNSYLIFITIVLIWFLLEFLSVRQTFTVPFNLFYGTRYGSWFILGPLTFYFFKSITQENWKFKWIHFLHIIPFILFTVLLPLVSNETLSHRQIHYGMLSVFDHRPKTVTPFEYLYSNLFYLQFLHLSVYLLVNTIMIREYVFKLKNEYSSIKNLLWIKIFNYLFILILLLVSTYLFILFESDIYKRELDYIYVVPIGLFIYGMSYKLSSQEWLPVKKKVKYQASSLKEKDKYIKQLENLMLSEKPYLKNNLRLIDLADSLSLNQHQVSQLINEYSNYSFFDFINKYRVKEATDLMLKHPGKNLLEIAFEAGFNNKTSFINAFKKFNKNTPSQYRKMISPS